ncbi:MAG: gliding motility-associated C-terminal domain-containing protein [Bacteroidetes bacterium]|nr:gliding motility-associated C-terminal domain-containing protein [Bacteroidota bacterium]
MNRLTDSPKRKIRSLSDWVTQIGIVFFLFFYSVTYAQILKRAEYFFDTDPGKGNGTSLSITQAASINQTFNLNINSLATGVHTLNIRFLDSNGHWSLFATRTFFIVNLPTVVSATTIKRAEYFFDTDPGTGNGKPLTITPGNPQTNTFIIGLGSLTPGFHQLAFRYQDNLGHWSLFLNRTFYIVPPIVSLNATTVKRAEYFFDTDPGVGLAKPLTITPANPQNNSFVIPISSLTPGFHQLAIRYQDNLGHWSLFANRTFYIVPPAVTVNATTLKRAEYFFDTDPGVGAAKPLTITPANSQNNSFAIPVSSLSPGFHQLAIRYQDNLGHWSTFMNRSFYVIPGTVVTKTLQRLEYFIDSPDPGFGAAKSVSITPAATINQPFVVDLSSLAAGNHTLNVRTKDSQGYWSTIISSPFTIVNCTPPGAPVVPPVSNCGTGTVNLVASGATGSQVYRWYATASSSSILFTGATYVTPTLSKDTSYYATIYDPSTTCESNRTKATVAIVTIPKPVLNLTGTLSVCGNKPQTLIAPPGFTTYLWSNGLTTQQITVTASGSYTVKVGNGVCVSPASDPFVLTINPLPAQPTINATGGGTLCGGGTVTLSVPAGFAAYSWSSGQTTSSIAVNSPGQFYVTVTDGNGCQSVPSNVFSVTASAPAQPTIVVNGNLALCNGSSVTLTAPNGFPHYVWSSGDTTQSITTTIAASYTVKVSNGACASAASNPVMVTQVSVPSRPSIQVVGDSVVCQNSFVGLSAPTGYSYYKWSDNESTAQIVVSTGGSYSVQVGNAPNCLSVASRPVAVTLSGKPCGSAGGNINDVPPSIGDAVINGAVGNIIKFDLRPLISKGTVGVDFRTLRAVSATLPISGAPDFVDASYNLILDYSQKPNFAGTEYADIQVCDSLNNCTQRSLKIQISAEIIVYNAVSPYQDGFNDYFRLQYIDQIAETKTNKVVIVDRWGNEVFSISDYDNASRVFTGRDNSGKDLPSGTYYYRVDFPSGRPTLTGFISLKR